MEDRPNHSRPSHVEGDSHTELPTDSVQRRLPWNLRSQTHGIAPIVRQTPVGPIHMTDTRRQTYPTKCKRTFRSEPESFGPLIDSEFAVSNQSLKTVSEMRPAPRHLCHQIVQTQVPPGVRP